ncbi:MAG TPA: CvpA family protein, partial [Ferruginibacter sp.]|nr:CvpA family protein [Ferruginibacter sp.]
MLIDLAFGVLMLLAIFKGYQKGFVIAVFSLLAFIIGLAAALKLSTVVAAYLHDSTSISVRWLPLVA